MGLFSKKKKEEPAQVVPEPAPPANPFPDPAPTQQRYDPYANESTFVPVTTGSRTAPPRDPLEAAALKKRQRDQAILDAIFHAFAKMLPTYGTTMKKHAPLNTTDYDFNEGNYNDRYKDLERQIQDHMEEKGWKVKDFSIRNSKTKSKSTLTKYYPEVKWNVMEPGSFKVKS